MAMNSRMADANHTTVGATPRAWNGQTRTRLERRPRGLEVVTKTNEQRAGNIERRAMDEAFGTGCVELNISEAPFLGKAWRHGNSFKNA